MVTANSAPDEQQGVALRPVLRRRPARGQRVRDRQRRAARTTVTVDVANPTTQPATSLPTRTAANAVPTATTPIVATIGSIKGVSGV